MSRQRPPDAAPVENGAARLAASGDPGNDDDAVLEALLDTGVMTHVKVSGSSLSPTLDDGDLAFVAPFLGLPRPGQIVLACIAGSPAIRRIAGVTMRQGRRRYRLERGAAVLREALLGRVVAAMRRGRHLPIEEAPDRPR